MHRPDCFPLGKFYFQPRHRLAHLGCANWPSAQAPTPYVEEGPCWGSVSMWIPVSTVAPLRLCNCTSVPESMILILTCRACIASTIRAVHTKDFNPNDLGSEFPDQTLFYAVTMPIIDN